MQLTLSVFRLLEQPSGFAWLLVPMLARHSAAQPLATHCGSFIVVDCRWHGTMHGYALNFRKALRPRPHLQPRRCFRRSLRLRK